MNPRGPAGHPGGTTHRPGGLLRRCAGPPLRVAALLAPLHLLAGWVLHPFLGAGPALLCAAAALTYPTSYLAHEMGHVLAYRRLAPPGAAAALAAPQRWTVVIERDRLPRREDVLVTLAGPLAGGLTCLAPHAVAALLGAGVEVHLALLPGTASLVQHVGSLSGGAADRQALVAALREPEHPVAVPRQPGHPVAPHLPTQMRGEPS
ncbi:hypothetical protein [Serinicoccus sediminis]|uniref:hypothetical protein n=1 Tax=Serinicoccus sediminis TaxID=2306021 RepID=UPI0010226FA3|nr:hypothetical protein [Serinicoccus sediminis]